MLNTGSKKSLNIWIFTDNKPGHKNQLQGLLNAIEKKTAVISHWINVKDSDFSLLGTSKVLRQHKNSIDLAIGAGHGTHILLLLTQILTRAKSIVLMKPSLPLSWFDLALIPEHDGQFKTGNVITTQGVINKIIPAKKQNPDIGLFLIGGPSKHYAWNSDKIAIQVHEIAHAQPEIKWHLTTSRRTPEDFLNYLQPCPNNITVIAHSETDSEWVPQKLSESGQIWVSADSVSMIYEALTAGAKVGLLEIPAIKLGRIQQGVNKLLSNHFLIDYKTWQKTKTFPATSIKLSEAFRCADLILKRLNHVN